jgi:mono/diheme cytochrome c family protein
MRMLRNTLIALVIIVLAAGGVAYAVVRRGLAADRPPSRLEAAIARRLVLLAMPTATRAMENPHAGDPDSWRHAADHFADHCAVCHGADGRGKSELGPRMYPPVPDLSSADVQRMSDGALFAIIQNGVRWTGMPAFGAEHDADETWRLVSFIRHVPHVAPGHADHPHEHAKSPGRQ